QTAFVESGNLPVDDHRMPRAVKDEMPVMALDFPLGEVGPQPVSRFAMVAYDDLYSMNYFGRRLRGYWRRNGMDGAGLLVAGARDYEKLAARCEAFDADLMADLTKAGG